MSNPVSKTSPAALPPTPPPDQPQRERALDPSSSVLVQAPAGSGKTDLLTRRFLRLLTEVEDPAQIVAITFTKAAAAEMRQRILSKLDAAQSYPEGGGGFNPRKQANTSNRALAPDEALPAQQQGSLESKASGSCVKGTGFSPYMDPQKTSRALAPEGTPTDPFSMESLARRAYQHSQNLGWNLLDQPAQLRISTIDSFCRDLALQQPLLTGLGDGLGIYEQPDELYRRAARQALEQIDGADTTLREAIETLLLWRDNNWQEMENQLVEMLKNRDRWMRNFVLEREQDWESLRENLERPFAKAIQQSLTQVAHLLDQVPGSRDEALALARFACQQGASALFQSLAELPDFPEHDLIELDALEQSRNAHLCLADLLLTLGGSFRKTVDKRIGFPADRKQEKSQILDLVERLSAIPGLESALAALRTLPPARYTDEDWQIIRACFILLRNAAAQLKVVFAETGAVDYVEVAQIALAVLRGPDGNPTDAAIAVADGIHHILVDEFQDTSRRQHELLRRLIAAWPDRSDRSCFVVGDPMQSIYFFRDADAELFPRVREAGLEIHDAEPLLFNSVALTSNFRTAQPLVKRLNELFALVFAANDGSGVIFLPADPARNAESESGKQFELHINFNPQSSRTQRNISASSDNENNAQSTQLDEIVALIRSHTDRMKQARATGESYRIAVLGRTRNALAPIAQALREADIPFRAVDLEKLAARPEILDTMALARAVLNPLDRVSWLGVLRAPWCGLSLSDLHTLTSADDPKLLSRPIPELLAERVNLLSNEGCTSANRVLAALKAAPTLRFAQPTASLGTWLEQLWIRLGGPQCVDRTARANLDLLWQSLDALPNGELDLCGPALDAALNKLTAQPDPGVSSDCGVQLMTIHKSKGLEFEVVIVPELQARSRRGETRLLSWLERGLPPEDSSDPPNAEGEITEFLVAPLQFKGSDRGTTKKWVDRVYRDRESQEIRRLLYVAATRARDELHLFAQPDCKQDKSGDWTLTEPKDSLLATAWPALHSEIERHFDELKANNPPQSSNSVVLESLAASADDNLLVMPTPVQPTIIHRLPADYESNSSSPFPAEMAGAPSICHPERAQRVEGPASWNLVEWVGYDELPVNSGSDLYQRHEGGLLSRALGTAVHSLLESLGNLRSTSDWPAARAALKQLEPRSAAQIRAAGIDPAKSSDLAAEALRLAINASNEPTGNWILSPHSEDSIEVRWTGVVSGSLRNVQVDRLFRAGLTPLSTGNEAWWIIDYKTAHADTPDPAAALPGLRNLFAPQLETYATVLVNLHGKGTPIRAGLYYPRMLLFDWWEI